MRKLYAVIFAITLFSFFVITTQSAKAQYSVTISGTGNASSHLNNPFYSWYQSPRYARTAMIYPQSLMSAMPAGSIITSLEFLKDNTVEYGTGNSLKLYLMNTSLTDWGGGSKTWDVSQATLVFDGDHSTAIYSSPSGWKELILQTSFTYTGQNLALFAEVINMNTSGASPAINFVYNTKTTQPAYVDNSVKYGNSSTSMPSSMGSSSANHSDMKINFTMASTCSGMPDGGNMSASELAVCSGNNTSLSLANYTMEGGITVAWQSSSTLNGVYTDIATGLTDPNYTFSPTAPAYYRAAVTCGTNTAYSDTLFIDMPTALMAGTYFIDSTKTTGGIYFNSFTDAINAIKCGANGSIIFKVMAGQSFTEDVPEISTVINPGDSIVFIKEGSGANPVIYPASPGIIASTTTNGAHGDAIIKINGSQNLVFDGIDLSTPPGFSGNGLYEYGYYFTRTGTSASKNVIIRNSNISLDKSAVLSFGIFSSANLSNGMAASISSIDMVAENLQFINNTISNAYGGILVRGSSSASFYDQGIQIKNNNISNIGGSNTSVYGIYTIYGNDVTISGNTLSNFTGSSSLYGIYTGTATNANVEIANNTISGFTGGGTTSAMYLIYSSSGASGTNNLINIHHNNITGFSYPTATSATTYMIYHTGSAFDINIHNNNIFSNNLTGTGTHGFIYNTGGGVNTANIFENNIYQNQRIGTSGTTHAIYNSPASAGNSQVYKNNIYNNSVGGGAYHGINQDKGATANIYKNNIYGLSSGNTSGNVNGIYIPSGNTTVNVYNNFISDLSNVEASSTSDAVRGIYITGVTANSNHNISHNTIYLNTTSNATNANFSSTGIYHSLSSAATSGNLTLINNIVVNTSEPQGTGTVSAFRRSSATSLNNFNSLSDHNLYYVGTPSANRVIFFDGTNRDQTLMDYKTRVSPAESNSVREKPPFVNVATKPYDLHIRSNVPTQIESGGIALAAVTDDFDGDMRDPVTPDIGADEFNGMASLPMSYDTMYAIHPGSKIYPSQPNQIILRFDVRTVNAADPLSLSSATIGFNGTTNIGDISSAQVSIYYTGPSADFNTNVLFGSSSPSLTPIPVSGFQELAVGSNYFWVVLDNINPGATTGNIVDVEITGLQINGTDNYVTPQGSPAGVMYIVGPMAGHYQVLPGASYPNFSSFSEAANDLYLRGVADTVFIDGTPGLFEEQVLLKYINGISEFMPVYFNGNGATITDSGMAVTGRRAVFTLDSAQYITIDGFNISTGAGTHGYGVQLFNNSDYNTIRNCNIINNTTASSTNYAGIVINSSATTAPTTTGDSKCDNNVIENNTIVGGYAGVALTGKNTDFILNNKVLNNTIRDFYTYGVYLNGNDGALVEGNDISRPERIAPITSFYGVYFTSVSINSVISKNKIHNPFGGITTSTSGAYGVNLGSTDASIGNENIIVNNLIYDFNNQGTQNGILNNGSDYVTVMHNTISLDDTKANCSSCLTRGIYEQVAATQGFEILNNIITIGRGGTGEKQALYFTSSDATAFNIDNNVYYFDPSVSGTHYLVRTASANYNTLSDWQTQGKDVLGKFTDPLYADTASDNYRPLSIVIDNMGQPLGVTEDINGATRSVTTPDPGAYEFTNITPGLNIAVEDLTTPDERDHNCYTTNEEIRIRIRNASSNPLDLSVNPVTVQTTVSGAVNQTLSGTISSGILASNDTISVLMSQPLNMSAAGVYIFEAIGQLAGDANAENDTMPAKNRTKVELNPGKAKASPNVFCYTGGAPQLTLNAAEGYSGLQWQQSTSALSGYTDIAGANDVNYTVPSNITQTMYYRALAFCGNVMDSSSHDTALISSPMVLTTTNDSICGAGTATLSATATPGATINWYTAATGGEPVAQGSSFTTPVINSSTNYYVSASANKRTTLVGRTAPKTSTTLSATPRGLVISVNNATFLKSLDVYPFSAGSGTVQLTNASGTVLQTANISWPAGNAGKQKHTVDVNMPVPAGTDMFLVMLAMSGNITYEISSNFDGAYPYVSNDGNVSITASRLASSNSTTTYYYFYNLNFEDGCTSARTLVEAYVDNTPGCSTLPVTGIVLKAMHLQGNNILNWSTLTEVNNAGFNIERSMDGKAFEQIGFINSKAENGNSSKALQYSFTDNGMQQMAYYRIKQTDKDGRYQYSNIAVVRGDQLREMEIVGLYPNPASTIINLQLQSARSGNVKIIITDVAGRMVKQINKDVIMGENLITIPVQELHNGTYLIRMTDQKGNEQWMNKFIKK